jgi:hypothetical protein
METTHEPLIALQQIKFFTVKDHGHTGFIRIISLFDETFKYGSGTKF